MPEPPRPPGIMGAPNRALVTARVKSVRPAENAPGKWQLELEFEATESLEGGHFARVGERADAFTFVGDSVAERLKSVAENEGSVKAEVEYLGGPQGGVFQLYDPEVLE